MGEPGAPLFFLVPGPPAFGAPTNLVFGTRATSLVQAAQYTLGPFGADSQLRRWGLKLAASGGKRGKKRAVVAVARKLAVLLHCLWRSGQTYRPFPDTKPAAAA